MRMRVVALIRWVLARYASMIVGYPTQKAQAVSVVPIQASVIAYTACKI